MLKLTRLSKYQDLLLEADIIQIGNDVNSLSAGDDKKKAQDTFDKIDKMLDEIIDKDIQAYLKNPQFINAFTADQVIQTINKYLEYCKQRVADTKTKVGRLILSGVPSPDEIRNLNTEVAKIQDRIDLLNNIYFQAKDEKLRSTLDAISDLKNDISSYYLVPITTKGTIIKKNLGLVKSQNGIEKVKAAISVFTDFDELTEIMTEYPDEAKAGLNKAKEQADEAIKSELSEEEYNQVRSSDTRANIFFTKIVKDILEFERLYGTEAEIKETARLLRNVRIANNPNLDDDSKAYLTAWVDQIEKELLKKAQDKTLQLEMHKGIHYDFNVKLPLFETKMLPVTGKQIANSTFLMRARKKAVEVLDLLFGGMQVGNTQAYDAYKEFGAQLSKTYSIVLNRTAKAIGRAVNGREGEMKADAVSRLLMPTQSYVDAYDAAKPTNEEAAAPGLSMQVPGSISSMGPITPPTQDSIGSGDDFNPKRKKKRIMEFSEFLKNKNQ